MRKWLAVVLALISLLTACAPSRPGDETTGVTLVPPSPLAATAVPPISPSPTPTTAPLASPQSHTEVPAPTRQPDAAAIPCAEGEICLTAGPVPVAGDGTVTLQWNAPGALKVDISWWNRQQREVLHAGLEPAGSLDLAIAEAAIGGGPVVTVYLRAYYGDDEADSHFRTLEIPLQAQHAVASFAVSPQRVDPGDQVTLRWEVTGDAQDVSITVLDESGLLTNEGYRDLAASGSVSVTVAPQRRNHMSFLLYASDAHGVWLSESAAVEITCPDVWFFPDPPADCPWPAHPTKMAVQRFEHGLMIWTEWEDRIRVFFDDSTNVHLRSWAMYENAWFEGMPESSPAIVPPSGYHQPVRGFGQLWREGSHRGTPIRELLGWAVETEWAIERGAVQCDTLPKYSTCYVGDPQGTVYLEEPEGSGWYEWAGPEAIP